jgi:hypothetical protein
MNPDRIYRQYRDDALAKQITAAEYNTFVAMPFRDSFSYRSKKIYEEVIRGAAKHANKLKKTERQFALPMRIDSEPETAVVITEEIVVKILESHLFIGDLTFGNPGVLLEVGVSFGLKPNKQVILIMQGDLKELHFDIRNNTVICYDQPDAIERIANALIAGANAFESDCELYISSITRTLSADAILCLNWYGRMRRDIPGQMTSLHFGTIPNNFDGDQNRFQGATRELLSRYLIWTDYNVGGIPGGDEWGMHATELGWAVIEYLWPVLKRPKQENT